MRRLFLKLAAGLSAAPMLAAAQPAPGATRVVFQCSDSDPAVWGLVLNNVANLQEGLGAEHVTVEVVAYGPGIGLLKADAPLAGKVIEAAKAGVAFKACQNTMRNRKLTPADMNAAAGYVPAGVIEIVKRQQDGWAYVRP